ncbi:something about silencing protein 10 [Thrips palmi]|uniref:Something about silencing protein 10 n=1 Tax=Thrips palmi TaxID=161013 RepID=A0A6P9ABS4_THRPL|nr:something about silencing protein 10 [Thrips palmi]
MDSDIEGKDDDFNLPDQRAWGKTRKNYYNTDYVDQDYGGFDGEDAEVAELEEQEAREIQKRLAAELDDNDFSLDVFTKTKEEEQPTNKTAEEIIKTDLSQLSSRQKLALLEKEAPELVGIIEEFRGIMEELQSRLQPALALAQNKQVPSPQLGQYIRTKYHLVNNYAMNMGFYLLLRARRLPVAAHPVVKRLLQYRQLLQQLEPLEEVTSSQLDDLLNAAKSGSLPEVREIGLDTKKKKQLRLLSLSKIPDVDDKGLDSSKLEDTPSPDSKSSKAIRSLKKESKKIEDKMPWENDFESGGDVPWATGSGSDGEDGNENMEGETEELDVSQEDADGKRAITWQMASNKGLIHRRKKIDRNPRLKNRMKYRKAQIRIKGQIRQPRTEVQRYGGEMTGIKKTVSKSIKLK